MAIRVDHVQICRRSRVLAHSRFFFYGNEGVEPAHIHVQRDRRLAKFWLGPVTLARSKGFAAHELMRVEALVVENRERFLEAWREFFDS